VTKICILSTVHSALDNRVFYREAQSLLKAGYEVTLIAIHPVSEVKNGVNIVGLPQVLRWQRPRLWWKLLKLARLEQADMYHFHDPELLLVTPWLRLLTGKPIIYDVHEVYTDFIKVKDYMPLWLRYPLAWISRWLEPLLSLLQSGLVFSDDEIAKTFRNIRKPKATLFNYPGMSFVEDAAVRIQDRQPRSPIVLHLGGHERNRGAGLMVEAFSQVLKINPNARLLLVGHFMPPSLEEEVRAQAYQRGIEHAVTIIGQVPFETIGDYLSQAAVGWLPWQPYPKNEKNIPTKLFEYMAYGVPIVSSDLHSTRPFVSNHKNGFLVDAVDPQAHAQAILQILQNPANGLEMGCRGQELVFTQFNWDAEEKKLLELYKTILNGH